MNRIRCNQRQNSRKLNRSMINEDGEEWHLKKMKNQMNQETQWKNTYDRKKRRKENYSYAHEKERRVFKD